jgi:LysR family hydrogen peroxide-inducible transcriptional activator
LLKKAKVTDKDLDLNDVWLLNEGHCLRNQVLNLCSVKRKAISKRQNLHFESGNLETLKNMVVNYQGFTLLPYLAARNLSDELQEQVRDFQGVIPTREVSLVHNRLFLKEKIINALEGKIIESLPDELQSLKKKKINIISIENN